MIHEMKLRANYFKKIKNGEKTFEVRLNDEKRKQIKIGDFIVFKKEPELEEELRTQVEDLILFESFEEMASKIPAKKLGMENFSKAEVVNLYHQFYSVQDENKNGVLAIAVQVR